MKITNKVIRNDVSFIINELKKNELEIPPPFVVRCTGGCNPGWHDDFPTTHTIPIPR